MKRFTVLLACLFAACAGWAQTARLQIIHNSPTPTVDIWVNGQPFLTNFEYRTATPYVDVPAGVLLDIGVAPSPSDDPSDIIANFPVTLDDGGTYVAIASGIVGNGVTPFTLNLVANTREAATSADVDLIVNHGSTDAPAVDVIARGVATIVSNASYGDVTPYITVPAANYTLDITPAGQNSEIVASYTAPLSGLGGGAAVVFASGFLAPAAGQPAFGLFAALPNGDVLELPAVQNTARVQIIHNSANPTVDIWVNGAPFLTNFEYRTATPYVDVPAGQTLSIGVAPSPSTSPADIIATFPANFAPNGTYVVLASGLVGDPTTPFTLNVVADTREAALAAGTVDLIVNHGSTDAPAVDVIARGVATIVSNASYGDVTSYITVPAGNYTLDVTPAGQNSEIVASYTAPLSGLGGGAAVVFASGFLAPAAGQPAFGLFAALPNGDVLELPAVQNTARVQIIHNSANPTVDIWVNGAPFLTNFEYRTATPYVDVPAGQTLSIGVAPSPSDDPSDIIATFPANFAIGGSYVVLASGLVGSTSTPFTLNVVENARESSGNAAEVDFIVNHGSTDAPAVDVIARGVATIVSNASYGDVTSYITVPAGNYTLDVTPAGQNSEIVASYTAPLSGLGGGAAVVFASGFLAPAAGQPAFGLFAALPNGDVLELPAVQNTARVQIIHNSANPTVDIWVNGAPFLTNFVYRTATPFVDVPAGQTLSIGVAPSPSDDPSDIIATFPVNFEPEGTYYAVASGLVGDPTTPFTINIIENARESALAPGTVDVMVNHGSTDAPAVDVIARGVATIVNGAEYGDFTPYITVPAANYTLDITPAGLNSEIVASYSAPLSGLGGGAALVFASGFLDDASIAPFGLFAALPNGAVIALPTVLNQARLQIIHNSASPTVDIWVNDELVISNLDYRTATPYGDVPAGRTLNIGVAPSPSDDPSDIIATFPVNFDIDGTYAVIASGLVGNATTPFTLNVVEGTREAATQAGNVDFIVNHGSTDAPAVDVIARGIATIVSDAAYGDVTDYISVAAGDYTLDITPAGIPSEILLSYSAPVSTLGGGAAVVFASGFLAPAVGEPAFGLFAALPDGTVIELPAVQNTARVQIIHNSASPTVDIWIDGVKAISNFEYRTATPYLDFTAGRSLSVGVAPSPSDDPSDIIALFLPKFEIDGSYVVIASGLVGNATTPFTLNVVEGTREAATEAGNVDFIVNHGSTDAPTVDVIARNVATIVSGASYGEVTDYISVPASEYILDITPAGQPNSIVASYDADLSTLGGGAAVVFASGFLSPGAGQPAFGLWVTLPDGTTFPLDFISNTNSTVEIEQLEVFPNPAADYLNVQLTVKEAAEVEMSLLDLSGKQAIPTVQADLTSGGHVQQIELDGIQSGIYLLMVKTATGTAVRKIVVE